MKEGINQAHAELLAKLSPSQTALAHRRITRPVREAINPAASRDVPLRKLDVPIQRHVPGEQGPLNIDPSKERTFVAPQTNEQFREAYLDSRKKTLTFPLKPPEEYSLIRDSYHAASIRDSVLNDLRNALKNAGRPQENGSQKGELPKRDLWISSPRNYFFDKSPLGSTDTFASFVLETELSTVGIEAMQRQFNGTKQKDYGSKADIDVIPVRFEDGEMLGNIREAVARRADVAFEQIVATKERLEKIKGEKGEPEMLRDLVRFAYKETKYKESTNDMISVFAPDQGKTREANCEGRARAMTILLQEVGVSSGRIKWELFSDHVRVVVETAQGPLLLENNVRSWKPTPGRAVVPVDAITSHIQYGSELTPYLHAYTVRDPETGMIPQPSDRDVSNADHRRTSSTKTVLSSGTLEAFGSGNVSGPETDEEPQILIGDPEVLELQSKVQRMARERKLPVPVDSKKTADSRGQQEELQKVIEEMEEIPVAPEEEKVLVERPRLDVATVNLGREALRAPLEMRLAAMDPAARREAVRNPTLLDKWKREFRVSAIVLAGLTAANPIYRFGEQMVDDVVGVAARMEEEKRETSEKSPTAIELAERSFEVFLGNVPPVDVKPTSDVYTETLSQQADDYWATTFDGMDYATGLSQSWTLEHKYDGKQVGSASLERRQDVSGWHDIVRITPRPEEKIITEHFWQVTAREMVKEADDLPVTRLIEFTSPDPQQPYSAESIIGSLHVEKMTEYLSEEFPHDVGTSHIEVVLDGVSIAKADW